MTNGEIPAGAADATPAWQPLGAIDRRVAGVLVEKAKTTPDAYPLTLNALRTGCNQKSNRYPLMQLDEEAVLTSLDRLRGFGAVAEVFGSGRVPRYRHYLYEWLGVDKVELAVVAELLLRGPQSEGDLRGRAARMEPIADLAALRPVLAGLKRKGLVVGLTPEGRGHLVTHALYRADELERVRHEHAGGVPVATASSVSARDETRSAVDVAAPSRASVVATEAVERHPAVSAADLQRLEQTIDQLGARVSQLERELDGVRQEVQDNAASLQVLRAELGE